MTQTRMHEVSARTAPSLTEHDNERAVDLIEAAERSTPYCPCGQHMVAVAEDDVIWLQCSSRSRAHVGLAGIVAKLTAFNHTRRLIVELPAAS